MKSLKVEWKDFALGFFIGVTICLYAYISNNNQSQTAIAQPSAKITSVVTN